MGEVAKVDSGWLGIRHDRSLLLPTTTDVATDVPYSPFAGTSIHSAATLPPIAAPNTTSPVTVDGSVGAGNETTACRQSQIPSLYH